MYGLRIVLADPDPLFRKNIKEKLLKAGYMVVGEAGDGRNALQIIFSIQPDLVIASVQLPGRDGLDVARTISEHRVAPVILVTEMDQQDDLNEALRHWLFSYIIRPVDEINLFPAIEVSVAAFRKVCRLEEENRKLKLSLETRKVLDRAKGLLIEHKGMTEQEAFKYIQKISMDKCLPIHNIANQIIKAFDRNKSRRGSDMA